MSLSKPRSVQQLEAAGVDTSHLIREVESGGEAAPPTRASVAYIQEHAARRHAVVRKPKSVERLEAAGVDVSHLVGRSGEVAA